MPGKLQAAPAPLVEGAAAPASFDISGVIKRVHFAYRAEGDGFYGGHGTYAVEVAGGKLRLRPLHHPDAGAEIPPQHRRGPADPQRHLPEQGNVVEGAPLELETLSIARGSARGVAPAIERGTVDADGTLRLERGGAVERLRNGEEGVEQSWEFALAPAGEGDLVVRVRAGGLRYVGATEKGLHFQDPKTGLGFRYGRASWVDAEGKSEQLAPATLADGEIVLAVPAATLMRTKYPATLDPMIGPELGLDSPVLGPSPASQTMPEIAWGGTSGLVVWRDERLGLSAVYGARVSAAGEVLDPAGFPITSAKYDHYAPSVAWNGTEWLVAWQDARRGTGYYDIYAARVSAAGAVRDPDGFAVSVGSSEAPAVAWGGTDWLVVWQDRRNGTYDIYGARVSAAGAVLDPTGFPVLARAGDQLDPAVAWGGTMWMVVWEDNRTGTSDIYGTRVTEAGVPLDPAGIPICTVSNYQWAPALAWGGTSWLVVWQSNKLDEPGDIRGGRVTETGATLDFSGFSISAAINLQGEPDVVWDGTDWLVVFEDNRTDIANRNISAARVSGSGTVLDPSGLAVSTAAQNQQMPRVAWTGTSALVVWQDYRVGGIYPDVYGARVSAAGAILDPAGIAISTSSNQQQGAAVGWDGTNWLVVWQDYRSGSSWDVYGARVTGAGVLLDPSGIAISALPRDQRAPALAWDGTNWLVVWEDLRSGTFTDVYGARVSAAGTVLDPAGFAISAGARAEALPAVASNGTGWLVVWSDYRGSASSDLYGARVSGAGAVLDPTGFAICTAAGDQGGSAVAWGGASWLVVWSDYRSGSSLGDVYGARVSGAGAVLDPSGTLIGAAGAWEAPSPKLSWNGVEWLVVWEDWRNVAWTSLDFPTLNRDVYGARVSAAGTVLDPTGIALSTADNAQAMPAVAWDGTSWLVVWQDYRSGTSWDAYGTRVSAAGALLEETGSLIQAGGQAPAVASDGSRKSLVAYHRLTPTDGTTRVFGRFYEYLLNGAACTGSQQCGSGHCVDGVCCDTACGGGGGAADCQACSKAAGAAADGTCSPLAAGTGCRPAAGVCDLAESCDGAAPECPADAKKAGTVCRAAAGECDLAEACDGVANDCPGDAFKPLDTACGDDGQVCTRDLCDGGGACRHPAGNAGTQCRAAGGVCDVAESCDGISPECPVDAKKLGTVCRGAAGECDLAESCDGVSDDCPGDAFKPTDTGCSDDGQACTRDLCDGSGSCRHPAGNAGTQCRAAAGPCDVAETCDGASPECPTDLLALPTVKCVAASCSAGILTPDAFCSGTSAACPAPALVSCGGFLCAGSACATSCAAQTDCAPGYWCEGSGACAAKGATAQECTSDAACLSGHCVDAVCCDRACAGQCEACDVAGSPGTCTPVVGSPRGGRASCASDGSPCGGACDGILTAACAYPGAGVTCRAAACASGQASLAGTCDGAGRCPAATVVACQGYLCEGDHCAGSCAGPGDCAEGYFCAAGACAAKLALGAVCPGATACLSGHCVDGVCCDRACGGQCEACGADGVCANVTGAPKGARPACAGAAASTCAGACDGTRPDACAYPGGTVSCRPPACADAIATPEGFCDGAGGCPSATTVACAPYLCEGTRCAGDCAVDGDCAAGNWCAAGVCTPKSERGSACGAGRECLSGECVDGLCCDRACAGQCEACDVDGKKGTCAPATGAPRGARAACATDGSGCGGACDGVGGEACAYPGSEASCRAASCADGVATLAATCNGQGACPGTETVACAPYLCKGTSCAGDCAADADCAEGRWCAAGVCQPKRENGLACGAGRECLSGECADAVCCDRACGGQCEACDVEGKKGTCAPVSGAPRGGRPACAGTGGCQGSCDGTLGERCAFPGAATECSPPSCTSGIAHPASTCDGAGACRAGEDQSCGAYACGQAACLTACSSDGDCASAALRCQGGACVPKPTVVDQGCGCATADASPMLALVGLALALARRHRRRA